jgi:hypothetical protein
VTGFIRKENVEVYRHVCGAMWGSKGYGCSGQGPRAFSYEEATEKAYEAGWELIEGRLVCPGHARAYRETA